MNSSKFDGKDQSLSNKSGPSWGAGREGQILLPGNIELHPPQVEFCDMTMEKKQFSFEIAEQAIRLMLKGEKRYFKDMAEFIKLEFDQRYKGSWNVVVGRHFGSYVAFESKCLILFWINSIGFLIFKFA